MTNCFGCGKQIFFDENIVSKHGKKIPLSNPAGSKHRCKAKPFNRETRRRYWQEENRKGEEEREKNRAQQQHEPKRSIVTETFKKACHILGVSIAATEQEIKNAYRNLMLRYHPDRCHDLDATEKTRVIIWAYEHCIPE